jgi:hypothetical protein
MATQERYHRQSASPKDHGGARLEVFIREVRPTKLDGDPQTDDWKIGPDEADQVMVHEEGRLNKLYESVPSELELWRLSSQPNKEAD